MKTRPFITLIVLLLSLGCDSTSEETSKPEAPAADHAPIVMISLDTTRRDHLPFYGYDQENAPRLSALARESVVFDDFVTMSSWTLPTHASLFIVVLNEKIFGGLFAKFWIKLFIKGIKGRLGRCMKVFGVLINGEAHGG